MKDETYYFHQTPEELTKLLIEKINIYPDDILFEPFKGEGSFFNNYPQVNIKHYTEIEEGLDYKDFDLPFDWIITNPPFQLNGENGRVNAFWYLLNYFMDKANKGIAFLGNDNCFSALTPKRIQIIKNKGWELKKLVVCSVKKWRGRYFFFIFEKNNIGCLDYIEGNF
jgi:hypothetical protein